jgi:hypothetical protein
MSTLRTNTLSNVAGTSSTAIENAIHGSAKAWVNFNGTGTVAIRTSYNVSSITDNGVGLFTINFTSSLSTADYSTVVSVSPNYGSDYGFANLYVSAISGAPELAPATSSFRISVYGRSTTQYDPKYACAAVFI